MIITSRMTSDAHASKDIEKNESAGTSDGSITGVSGDSDGRVIFKSSSNSTKHDVVRHYDDNCLRGNCNISGVKRASVIAG